MSGLNDPEDVLCLEACAAEVAALRREFLLRDESGLSAMATHTFLLALAQLSSAQHQLEIAAMHQAAALKSRGGKL